MHSCDDDVMLLNTKQAQENQISSEGWKVYPITRDSSKIYS